MRFFMASCLMNLRKYRYVVSNEMLANSQESLAISKQYGSKQNQLECHFELGFLYLWRHEYDHASEYLLLALELAKNTGNMVFQTLCLTYMAVLYRFKGQIREVEKFSQQMEQTARTANMPDYLAAAKANQAWLAWRAGDFSTTEKLSKEALEIWQRSPMVYPCQWLALWPLIGVASKKERQDEAFTYVNALLTPTQQHFPATLNDMLEEVLKMHQVGNIQEAHVSLDQALDIALKMGYL
jgi:tetratricopeptide (TPR) repeat protein